MHCVHYMQFIENGWICPGENLEYINYQHGSFVVPVNDLSQLFPDYVLEYVKYSSFVERKILTAKMNLIADNALEVNLDGQNLIFNFVFDGDKPVIYNYKGNRSHDDFHKPLAKIDSVDLDELFSKTGIIVLGTHPKEEGYGI